MMHDAILKLSHIGLIEFLIQLWLAEQYDLQQLVVAQLQVI